MKEVAFSKPFLYANTVAGTDWVIKVDSAIAQMHGYLDDDLADALIAAGLGVEII